MNWTKVADDLREQAVDAIHKSTSLQKVVTTAVNDQINIERIKIIERHRINANFCVALAQALEAGLIKKGTK